MKSVTTDEFRRGFTELPSSAQKKALQAYRLWKVNPRHPGLHFKRIHALEAIYSVRIGLHYRAIALVEEDTAIWFWIGSHSDYDNLIGRL